MVKKQVNRIVNKLMGEVAIIKTIIAGALTWLNDQMAERPNRMAKRPNSPIRNCPLFDVNGTILEFYQNYGKY